MTKLNPQHIKLNDQELTANSVESAVKQSSIWEIRTQEQPYAFLNDNAHKESNCYGQKIDLLSLTEGKQPEGRSLFINGNPEVGSNPNRNKQHGFYFTADNCIGCHACEAACSEKNNNPPHLAFRSVGYVEGGSYPDYRRMNISMACNHCDDPVCLKGCPTRAYTKHAEYGAVLQDPETCFGCGYCTWVCPYNAPQLDPVQGQVSKCNMCVDRLEVGLKPACVSACVGNALDFGVIENIPANREQAKASIPGFPDPNITRPNIRFQQTKTMPEEVRRTDSIPVKYHRNGKGQFKPTVDRKKGDNKYWNLSRLSSRENPLVLFTLGSQTAIGAFMLAFLAAQLKIDGFLQFSQSAAYLLLAAFSLALTAFGLFISTTHLGKPLRFYRGFNNLRYSPVCREGLGIASFMAALAMHILFSLPANSSVREIFLSLTSSPLSGIISFETAAIIAASFGYLAIAAALAGLYYMYRCYRIKARPFWDHWQTGTSFLGNTLSLGALLTGSTIMLTTAMQNANQQNIVIIAGTVLLLGMILEAIGLIFHHQAINNADHEGAASHYIQRTTFGKTYIMRNVLMTMNIVAALILIATAIYGTTNIIVWSLPALCLLVTCITGRALFYVLVIPTTMPGAFFWKNKGFEEHARDIGLARLPQVGVLEHPH